MPEKFGVAALSCFSLMPACDELVDRRRHLEPGLLEQVRAVHDDAGAGVVGHAVELAVVGAGLDQALQQVVAAEVGLLVGQVGSAPAASKAWAWVLPSSTTSGLSLLDSAS